MTRPPPPRDDGKRIATVLGIVLLLIGLLLPPLLFPKENQILVGFIGSPFVLFGFILLLIGAFPTQRLSDKNDKDDGGSDGPK
jgi:hypothetical protein